MSKYSLPFYVKRDVLTDGSVQFEVRADKNIDCPRIACTDVQIEAVILAAALNQATSDFVNANVTNTVDL